MTSKQLIQIIPFGKGCADVVTQHHRNIVRQLLIWILRGLLCRLQLDIVFLIRDNQLRYIKSIILSGHTPLKIDITLPAY